MRAAPIQHILVNAFWDEEAQVWVATSEDVPGLVTEANTLDELDKKIMVLIPELLEANGIIDPHKGPEDCPEVPLELVVNSNLKLAAAC